MIGKDIYEVRTRLKLSRDAFAQRLGVSAKTLERWEKGQTQKIPDTALKKIQSMAENDNSLFFSPEVKLFLQSQAIKFGSMPPWVLLHSSSLGRASAANSFVDRKVKKLRGDGPSEIRLSELPQLANQKPVFLLGPQGIGKTFTIRWIADRQGRAAQKNETSEFGTKIPIIFPLRQLSDTANIKKLQSFESRFLAAIASYHKYLDTGLRYELLEEICQKGQALFLFDALDEIDEKRRREEVTREIEMFMLKYANCSYIFTNRRNSKRSRTLVPDQYIEANLYELGLLNSKEQEDVIVRLYSSLSGSGIYQGKDQDLKERTDSLIKYVKDKSVTKFLFNPLNLVLVILLFCEGRNPRMTFVEVVHESLEVSIEKWPNLKGIEPSSNSHELVPGTDINKNLIWSKLSEIALEIIESDRNTVEIEKLEGWLKNDFDLENYQEIAKQIIRRLPLVIEYVIGQNRIKICDPYLLYLAAHCLTEKGNVTNWILNEDNRNNEKKYENKKINYEIWSYAIQITSLIHKIPGRASHWFEEFVQNKFGEDPKNSRDFADPDGVISCIIYELMVTPGVIERKAWKNVSVFLMKLYLETQYEQRGEFFFEIFQKLQKSKRLRKKRTLLREALNSIDYDYSENDYDKLWRIHTLKYAIGLEEPNNKTEDILRNILLKFNNKYRTIKKDTSKWKDIQKFKRRTIFALGLLQKFSADYYLKDETIKVIINIARNIEDNETSLIARCRAFLSLIIEKNDNINSEIKKEIYLIINNNPDSNLIIKLEKFDESLENCCLNKSPSSLIESLSEIIGSKRGIYTSLPVIKVKNIFAKAYNFYAKQGEDKAKQFVENILNNAVDRSILPLLRAAAFSYIKDIPKDWDKILELKNTLEDALKNRAPEDEFSVGAIQIYDYNYSCLNKRYATDEILKTNNTPTPIGEK